VARPGRAVGRIGEEQINGGPVQESVEVGSAAGIPAQEPIVTEEPVIAGPGDGFVGRLRDVIRVGQPIFRLSPCQGRRHRGAERPGVYAELGQEFAQLRLVGRGHRRERVED
jgi:hypothetical protein